MKITYILTGFVLVVLILEDVFLTRYVQNNLPDEWKRMGKPKYFFNSSAKSTFSTIKYMAKGEYKMTGNKQFIARCRIIYTIKCIAFLVVMLFFSTFFIL